MTSSFKVLREYLFHQIVGKGRERKSNNANRRHENINGKTLKDLCYRIEGEGNLSNVSIKELADFISAVTSEQEATNTHDIYSTTELDERSKQVVISCEI